MFNLRNLEKSHKSKKKYKVFPQTDKNICVLLQYVLRNLELEYDSTYFGRYSVANWSYVIFVKIYIQLEFTKKIAFKNWFF